MKTAFKIAAPVLRAVGFVGMALFGFNFIMALGMGGVAAAIPQVVLFAVCVGMIFLGDKLKKIAQGGAGSAPAKAEPAAASHK